MPRLNVEKAGEIRFEDGKSYERYMGRWSKLVGESFLDWLSPQPGLSWLDVGCGNGAFTELIAARCSPNSLDGIDPSEPQLAFARSQPVLRNANFVKGGAMELPYPDDSFDVAVMPLVIFFVPEPVKGVAEMMRVTRPGGLVTSYGWDLTGGGFPYQALQDEMRILDASVGGPPNPSASRMDVLRETWTRCRLEKIKTTEIIVRRTFENFEDYWAAVSGGPSVAAGLKALTPEKSELLKNRLKLILPADFAGRITCQARANAIQGIKEKT